MRLISGGHKRLHVTFPDGKGERASENVLQYAATQTAAYLGI